MRSDAATVQEYLDDLDDDRREALTTVRDTIRRNLPEGYVETMSWGMISYEVPMERSGPTYNGKPLVYVALASQKNHMAVYLTSVYADEDALETFKQEYKATGKRLDMGKSCVLFRTLDDLPLDVLGRSVASVDVEQFLGMADRSRA